MVSVPGESPCVVSDGFGLLVLLSVGDIGDKAVQFEISTSVGFVQCCSVKYEVGRMASIAQGLQVSVRHGGSEER